jgi:hypothetical protein
MKQLTLIALYAQVHLYASDLVQRSSMKKFLIQSIRCGGILALVLVLGFATQLGTGQPRPSAAPWVRNTTNPSLVELGIPAEDIVVIGVTRTPLGKLHIAGGNLYLADGLLTCGLREGCIGPGALRSGTVSTASIAPAAIDGSRIAAATILGSHIAPSAIDASKLANGAVSLAKLAPCTQANQFLKWTGTAWSCEIAPVYSAGVGLSLLTNNVFSLADNGVTTAKLANQSVTTAKLALGSVDSSILKDGEVTGGDLGDGAVTTQKIKDGAVTKAKIANGSIDKDKLEDDAVETTKIKDAAITKGKIANGSIDKDKLENDAVETTKIKDAAITKGKIANGSIDKDKLENDAVETTKIKNAAVTSNKLAPCSAASPLLKWNGAWACAADNTYSAGTGLNLTGTVFSLAAPTASALGGVISSICAGTDKATGIDPSGAITCAADIGVNYVAGAGLLLSGSFEFSVALGGIATAMLADGAVTPAKLAACSAQTTNQFLLWEVTSATSGGGAWKCADLAGNLEQSWSLRGNAAKPGEFLGTTNNEPFEIRVNNNMALRIDRAGASNQFELRADGGMTIFSRSQGPTTGVRLAPGSNAWSQLSDRHLKENITPVNGHLILEKLRFLPITRWNLKSQNSAIKHIGPMAQDFYAAFGLGESDRYINASDADGIALLSIQALYLISLEKEQEIKQLQKENQELRANLNALQKRLEALEQAVQARK